MDDDEEKEEEEKAVMDKSLMTRMRWSMKKRRHQETRDDEE